MPREKFTMTDSQQTFDDFGSATSAEDGQEQTESINENDAETSGGGPVKTESRSASEISCETQNGGGNSDEEEASNSLAQHDRTISTEPSIKFGKDPDEFDISCQWARRHLAHRCTDTLQKKSLKKKTLQSYESVLREYTNFLSSHNRTTLDAEFDIFEDYILFCVEVGRRTNTIMNRVGILRGLYKHIQLNEEVEAEISPLEFDQIERSAIDDLTPNHLEREALTRDELEKLFDAMSRERDRLMAITGTETGFRNSDIRGIRMTDIDLDGPEIYAQDPKNSKPYTVPISEELALELEIWIETGRQALLGQVESRFLFPSEEGGQIESSFWLNKIVRNAAEEAGIQGVLGRTQIESEFLKESKVDRTWHRVIPHVLRHSFITILEKEGVSLEYRRLLANHSSAETTRAYSHGKKELMKQAQGRVDLKY